ncbi:MAG: hypothetical protein LAP40_01095 [Acidobacteriia bacterium]|nr:hypothetical protein [Terriglobia bacterium]
MVRFLYLCLLGLHPPAFRDQFGGEMLWIFDQTEAGRDVLALFSDGGASLVRQWLLRSGAWKMATGGVVSLVVIGGMLSGAAIQPAARRGEVRVAPHCPAPCEPADFRGQWAGNFHWPGPSGQMMLTFTNTGDTWNGELVVQGGDGVAHRGAAEDLRFDRGSVSFRVQTAHGPMRFYGWVAQGKLTGALEPADGVSF